MAWTFFGKRTPPTSEDDDESLDGRPPHQYDFEFDSDDNKQDDEDADTESHQYTDHDDDEDEQQEEEPGSEDEDDEDSMENEKEIVAETDDEEEEKEEENTQSDQGENELEGEKAEAEESEAKSTGSYRHEKNADGPTAKRRKKDADVDSAMSLFEGDPVPEHTIGDELGTRDEATSSLRPHPHFLESELDESDRSGKQEETEPPEVLDRENEYEFPPALEEEDEREDSAEPDTLQHPELLVHAIGGPAEQEEADKTGEDEITQTENKSPSAADEDSSKEEIQNK